jgi:glutamyl aminopeptidase
MIRAVLLMGTVFSCGVASEVKYRLDKVVKPFFYTISIHPDLDQESFIGEVFIHVRISSPVRFIEFHSSNLTVTSLYLNHDRVAEKNTSQLYKYEFLEHELVRITDAQDKLIPSGFHFIHIRYQGLFSKRKTGMFKAGVTRDNKTVSYLVATDFEPTHARTVFPCFDEPAFKAKFQLNLVVPNSSYTALSNMESVRTFSTPDGVFYKFDTTTHQMSTYLLAFVITQVDYIEYVNECNIPLRLYSPSCNNTNNTKLLKFASDALRFYSQYTGMSYTFPKIDLVEYDRNHSAATENWGLITFCTGLLCSNDEMYDDSQRYKVLAHEVAHFWFGNLVTNDWWDDIWLQEGFATFMGLKAERHIFKNSDTSSFSLQYDEDVYWSEYNLNSTPIVNFEETPEGIKKNFNDATYTKGAVLLQMAEQVMGEDHFKCAIRRYICHFATKTATTKDLLKIMQEVRPDLNLREFMESYLYQNEYPIFHVEEKNNEYVLTQSGCKEEQRNKNTYKWTVPITYITSSKSTPTTIWFDRNMDKLTLRKSDEKWIKFNYKEIGYYIVKYSPSLWEKFLTHIREVEKFDGDHLLQEALTLFDANKISCDVVLRYFQKQISVGSKFELNLFLVNAKLSKIKQYDEEAYKLFKIFLRDMLKEAKKDFLAEVVWGDDESYVDATNQTLPPSDQMKACIKWLKNNVRRYKMS